MLGRMRLREWLAAVALVQLAACSDDEETKGSTPEGVGEPCILDTEEDPTFSGFSLLETSVGDTTADVCKSGVCLANHFQGRVSCPYGQTATQAASDPACFVPGSNEPITVPVDPQVTERPPATTVTCSCQCGGLPDGENCECPTGTVCASLSSGSPRTHCMIERAIFDPTDPPPIACDESRMNCGDPRPYPPP
jgi:hypothetical protein